MLVEFRVTNYRSIKDTQILSMVASSDRSLLDNTISTEALGKLRLNRSAVIYGANASGKSNVLAALSFVRDFVRSSTTRGWRRSRGEEDEALIPIEPFQLDDRTREEASEFELVFIHQGVRYQYGFRVDSRHVHGEWLIAYPHGQPQRWFERTVRDDSSYDWTFQSKQFRGDKQRIAEATRPDALYLSVGSNFNLEQLRDVIEWFEDIAISLPSDRVSLYRSSTAKRAYVDADFKQRVVDLLVYADVGIVDMRVDEALEPLIPTAGGVMLGRGIGRIASKASRVVGLDVAFAHQRRSDQAPVFLPLSAESRGTQQLFELARRWIEALDDGELLVVDELDSSLHPALARKLVEMVHNPRINRHGTQLICNTHDATLLDQTLFRRDQIWLTEKDREGATHLYSLLTFKPRKEEALIKGYLKGRYGAIPFFEGLDTWLAETSPTSGVASDG